LFRSRRGGAKLVFGAPAGARLATNPASSIALVVFVLVALTVSRLSSRITEHAREAESRGGQMENLYEFTRRT